MTPIVISFCRVNCLYLGIEWMRLDCMQSTSEIKYCRPIQYLGSKTRSINSIVSVCRNLYKEDSYIVDLFSGSSIVAQALSNQGMSVIANDVMKFCNDIAVCMLGVEKSSDTLNDIDAIIEGVRGHSIAQEFLIPFSDYLGEEELLLRKKDLAGLKTLYEGIPQVGGKILNQQIQFINSHLSESAAFSVPLFANYYAGSYFGIKQALDLDSIRSYIELFPEEEFKWIRAFLLTAFYSTMSIIVNSAGKHFAQPIAINDMDLSKITNHRLFTNRSYDVKSIFVECAKTIFEFVSTNDCQNSNNLAFSEDVGRESLLGLLNSMNVSVIYADPPYTAQQYSRFYHIPEIAHDYCYPQLQLVDGHITTGRYPANKFQSAFCSKSKVEKAFSDVFNLVEGLDSNLVLSYSESKKETGNSRMITVDDIINHASKLLPDYEVSTSSFSFKYKQLNKAPFAVKDSDDSELLLVFRKR